MRWSEAMTLEFLKIYLKHECLWNPSHPGYKIRYERERAYSDISREFKGTALTTAEVKIKFKNLRTTYMQEVQKILQKSSPDSMYEPSLVWFHEMDRCLKHIPSNRHSNSFNNTQEAEDPPCTIWVEQELQNANEEANPDMLDPQTYEDYGQTKPNEDQEHITNIQIERHPSPAFVNRRIKKKKLNHRVPKRKYSVDINVSKEDEFDCYGKFIAAQMRTMKLHKVLRLQLEIQHLINEARISEIE